MTYVFMTISSHENGHRNRSIDYEIKNQEAVDQELSCKFIRIDPDKEDFDIFGTIMKYLDTLNNQLKKL